MYKPRTYQYDLHVDDTRYKVIVFHRQAGKTTWAVHELLMKASEKIGTYFYIANTRDQAKRAAWKKLKEATKPVQSRKPNESDLVVELVNGSTIQLVSAEVGDNLRGATLEGVVFDEYQNFVDEKFWQGVIRPMLLTTKGWAAFIGTPNTKNHFYNLFMYGQPQSATRRDNWRSWLLTVEDTQIFDKADLKDIKEETTENTFKAEYLCEFLDGEGKVFRRIRDNIAGQQLDPLPGHEYVIGVDLAQYEDWTVLCVVNRHTHHVDYVERFNQIDWELQNAKIEALTRRYNNAYLRVDSTGKGDPVAENLEKKGLGVDRFLYTNKKKKELIQNLQLKMDNAEATYYHYEPLIHELEVFEMDRTHKGNITYNAPAGHHDDCVNAMALAYWDIGEKYDPPSIANVHPLMRETYQEEETTISGY